MDKKINTDKEINNNSNSPQEEGNDMALSVPIKKTGLTPEKKEGYYGKIFWKASLSVIREIKKNESN